MPRDLSTIASAAAVIIFWLMLLWYAFHDRHPIGGVRPSELSMAATEATRVRRLTRARRPAADEWWRPPLIAVVDLEVGVGPRRENAPMSSGCGSCSAISPVASIAGQRDLHMRLPQSLKATV